MASWDNTKWLFPCSLSYLCIYPQQGGYVFTPVRLLVCLLAQRITQKPLDRLSWNLMDECDMDQGTTQGQEAASFTLRKNILDFSEDHSLLGRARRRYAFRAILLKMIKVKAALLNICV